MSDVALKRIPSAAPCTDTYSRYAVYNTDKTNHLGPSQHLTMMTGHAAAMRLKYTPQPRPMMLPSRMRRSTGTMVKLMIEMRGHSFKPAVITGQKSCNFASQRHHKEPVPEVMWIQQA